MSLTVKTLQDKNLPTIDYVPGWDADEKSKLDAGVERTVDCRSARRTYQNQRREMRYDTTLS